MLIPMTSEKRFEIIQALDAGRLEEIKMAGFTDGYEDEFRVEFYRAEGRIFRTCYDRRSTCSTYDWVEGEAAERLARMN